MTERLTYEELEARVIELEKADADRKRSHAAMRKRLLALTEPLNGTEDIQFEDLFDLNDLKRLQDEFASATGVASIITRPDGIPITRPSNFCRLCRDIIRKTKKGRDNCYKSNALIGRQSDDGPIIQPCICGGLWNAGAAISISGKHLANWLIGQVRDHAQTEAKIRAYAREIGVEPSAMVEAFNEVPAMSRDRFEKIAQMLFTLANQLSASAYQTVQQARFIAERRHAEEALKESETRLRTLIRTIPDLVWLKDRHGVYLFCNSRFESLYAAKEKDIIGKTDSDFVTPEQADFFRRHDQLAMTKGGPRCNEENVTFLDDGHREILETIKTPVFAPDGRLVGVLGIGRDITERKRAEEERELLIAAIEQVGEMITLTDPNGIIQYVNQAFERATGYNRGEIIGQSPQLLDSNRPDEAFFQRAWQTVSSGRTWTERVIHKRKDGTHFPVAASVSPVRDAAGRIINYVSVKRDITEHLRLEAQFHHAQKMESVGRLAGGVAHDYNNMLGVIVGHAELALRRVSRQDPQHTHLKAILDAANRSAAITRQLLAFARKQTINPKVLDLNETVEGLLKMVRRLVGEQIDMVWIPKTGLWPVKMDPSQIDQILVNLCVNARDAIEQVGKITIETGMSNLGPADCADHMGLSPGAFVLLVVSDNGCGMDRETLGKIFEPFFTTKDATRGTGLGLATVYGIVKQNNGLINAYSEPGRGTTFKIYLPRYIGPADDTGTTDATPQMPLGRGEFVLIVEDEAAIMEISQTILQSLGYQVLTTVKPSEALSLAQQHASRIDLLVTDVVMPEMNGRVLADQIRAFCPKIRTLFMSGYTADVIAHQGILEKGIHFIQKPFSMQDLATQVRTALDDVKA